LLNFVHRGIERDFSASLLDDGKPDVVVGVSVKEEIEAVRDRRADIYPDFVDFLLADNGKIEDYDPTERRPYFQENDRSHIQTIQMRLAQLDDRAEIQRRLRRFVRAAERRLEYLLSEIIPDALFDQQPGLMLIFALQETVPNDDDCNVIGDAALWTAEEPDSSGVLLTMDRDDLLAIEVDINDTLREERDDSWELRIFHPSVLDDLPPTTTSQD
jgi:hypothetical protein